jgi:ribosome-associated protein
MDSPIAKQDSAKLRDFVIEAARHLYDRRCEDIQLLDVRGLSQVCDYILVASGTSERQMKTVVRELADLGDEHEHTCFRTSADTSATWIVADFIDLVVHLFEPAQRAYYDLESLWSDALRVDWRRDADEGASPRAAHGEPRRRTGLESPDLDAGAAGDE